MGGGWEGRQELNLLPGPSTPTPPGPSPAPAGDLISSWAVNITQTLQTPKLSSSSGPSPELSPHSPHTTPPPRCLLGLDNNGWLLLPHPHLRDVSPMPAAQGRHWEAFPLPPSSAGSNSNLAMSLLMPPRHLPPAWLDCVSPLPSLHKPPLCTKQLERTSQEIRSHPCSLRTVSPKLVGP